MRVPTLVYILALFATTALPLVANEPPAESVQAQTAAGDVPAKHQIEQLDQKLQQLFSKIKGLQEEREQLEALIEAKEDQLESLQEEVIAVLKQRDFYEQELGEPEDLQSSPYQP